MIARAALDGDRQLALQAMVNDPLLPDLHTAKALLDDLLAAHAAYLPQFARRVAVAA
jgi:6-phospho-beta-glucosidase